jgi:uncharacterized protein (DUF58 family)
MSSDQTPPGPRSRLARALSVVRERPQPPSASVPQVVTRASVLRGLELDIVRRLDGMLSGDHLSTAIGPGSERAGSRRYEPGDDARKIDWNLTARSLSAHVSTTQADRELETWIVADRSASLDFGTSGREKREVVLAVAAAFGILTVRAGNRFGVLVCGGDELVRVPARTGRTAMLGALARLHDAPRPEGRPGEKAGLGAALDRLARTQPRRGQIVVVSDFLDAGDWPKQLRALALRHQVVAAHVSDPRELTLPSVGLLAVVDPETGRQLHVQTGSSALRERYAAAAAERQTRIVRSIRTSGAEYLALSTDRDWVRDTVAFATGRRSTFRNAPHPAGVSAR